MLVTICKSNNACQPTSTRLMVFAAFVLMFASMTVNAASVTYLVEGSNTLVTLNDDMEGVLAIEVQSDPSVSTSRGGVDLFRKFAINVEDDALSDIELADITTSEGWKVKLDKSMDGLGRYDLVFMKTGKPEMAGRNGQENDISTAMSTSATASVEAGSLLVIAIPGLEIGDVIPDFAELIAGVASRTGAPGGFTGGAGQVTLVPLPASLWLFGSGLVAVAGLARRRCAA